MPRFSRTPQKSYHHSNHQSTPTTTANRASSPPAWGFTATVLAAPVDGAELAAELAALPAPAALVLDEPVVTAEPPVDLGADAPPLLVGAAPLDALPMSLTIVNGASPRLVAQHPR